MARALTIKRDCIWSANVKAFLDFGMEPHRPQGRIHKQLLGQYGGGKTRGGSEAAWRICAAHGNRFINDRPGVGGITVPTAGSFLRSVWPELEVVIPPEAIRRRIFYGADFRIELESNIIIRIFFAETMRSDRGGQGPSLLFNWIEEVQDARYADPLVWQNITDRVRDARSLFPHILSTGIAFKGSHVETYFRKPPTPNRRCFIVRTRDNAHNLIRGIVDDRSETLPASAGRVDAEGWLIGADDAIWSTFTEENMDSRDLTPYAAKPVHLGVDLRTHSAVVAGVDIEIELASKKPAPGLLLTDQLMLDRASAERVVGAILQTAWGKRVGPGSTITLDPTLIEDEINHFKRGFPGAKIIQHKTDIYHDQHNGIRCVDWALCDLAGNRRLRLHRKLETDASRRGIVPAIRSYDGSKWSPLAHAADAGRYITCTRLPLPGFSYGVGRLAPDDNLRQPAIRPPTRR